MDFTALQADSRAKSLSQPLPRTNGYHQEEESEQEESYEEAPRDEIDEIDAVDDVGSFVEESVAMLNGDDDEPEEDHEEEERAQAAAAAAAAAEKRKPGRKPKQKDPVPANPVQAKASKKAAPAPVEEEPEEEEEEEEEAREVTPKPAPGRRGRPAANKTAAAPVEEEPEEEEEEEEEEEAREVTPKPAPGRRGRPAANKAAAAAKQAPPEASSSGSRGRKRRSMEAEQEEPEERSERQQKRKRAEPELEPEPEPEPVAAPRSKGRPAKKAAPAPVSEDEAPEPAAPAARGRPAKKTAAAAAASSRENTAEPAPAPKQRGRKRKSSVGPGDTSIVEVPRGPPLPKSRGLLINRREVPGSETGGTIRQTRSGRNSFKPLAFWRNERVDYDIEDNFDSFAAKSQPRKFVLPSIKAIVRNDEPEDHRKAPGRKGRKPKADPEGGKPGRRPRKRDLYNEDHDDDNVPADEWEVNPGAFTADVMVWQPEHDLLPPAPDDEVDIHERQVALSRGAIQTSKVKDATFRYAKTINEGYFGAGVVDLPPGAEKRQKNSRKMFMTFFVHAGKCLVKVNGSEFRISKGGMWFVPRGEFSNSFS